LQAAAEALVNAEKVRQPIAPLSLSMPDLNESEAYEIARRRTAAIGKTSIGYKLGYTSAAMRAQMGVTEPNYGVLLAGSEVPQNETVSLGELIHPLLEPEITFLMGRDLAGPEIGREEAWRAVAAVMGSLEIVDTRYESYKFSAVDNISDNSSAARFVLGDRIERNDTGDLGNVPVRFEKDGTQIEVGKGSDAMGDPVLALAWLANKLVECGSGIRAGELIMTGGLTKAHPAEAGSQFTARFEGIGAVTAQF
jgi:2-keto-4-pentenoate hydratase